MYARNSARKKVDARLRHAVRPDRRKPLRASDQFRKGPSDFAAQPIPNRKPVYYGRLHVIEDSSPTMCPREDVLTLEGLLRPFEAWHCQFCAALMLTFPIEEPLKLSDC